jgi:hypothetical protein
MNRPGPDDDDIDAPQDIDLAEDEDGLDTIECPGCGGSMIEGMDRCPRCGQWLFGETTVGRRSRGWFWPLAVALLIAVILVLWHGLRR